MYFVLYLWFCIYDRIRKSVSIVHKLTDRLFCAVGFDMTAFEY